MERVRSISLFSIASSRQSGGLHCEVKSPAWLFQTNTPLQCQAYACKGPCSEWPCIPKYSFSRSLHSPRRIQCFLEHLSREFFGSREGLAASLISHAEFLRTPWLRDYGRPRSFARSGSRSQSVPSMEPYTLLHIWRAYPCCCSELEEFIH